MNNPLRARGMADVAYQGYFLASQRAGIDIAARADWRVVQALGDAVASAGYHHTDGTLDGAAYTAAVDLSVRGLSRTQLATWLECLCCAGFVAFYRNWPGNGHIHANYAGLPQKPQLDAQNEDFFAGRDGLVGHRRIDDEWWYPEIEARRAPEAMFRLSNPRSGGKEPIRKGLVVRSPLATPPVKAVPLWNELYLGSEKTPRFAMPIFEGVSYAPVRSFGLALGFGVEYLAAKNQVVYDGEEIPIALRVVDGIAYAPVRQLAREVGLRVVAVDGANHKVTVAR